MSQCKCCNGGGSLQYMTEEEFEIFSPLYYCMSYDEYKKNMHEKNCKIGGRNA